MHALHGANDCDPRSVLHSVSPGSFLLQCAAVCQVQIHSNFCYTASRSPQRLPARVLSQLPVVPAGGYNDDRQTEWPSPDWHRLSYQLHRDRRGRSSLQARPCHLGDGNSPSPTPYSSVRLHGRLDLSACLSAGAVCELEPDLPLHIAGRAASVGASSCTATSTTVRRRPTGCAAGSHLQRPSSRGWSRDPVHRAKSLVKPLGRVLQNTSYC